MAVLGSIELNIFWGDFSGRGPKNSKKKKILSSIDPGDGGPLVPQLTPNLYNISHIERTSLGLIMKKYHANLGINRMIKYNYYVRL